MVLCCNKLRKKMLKQLILLSFVACVCCDLGDFEDISTEDDEVKEAAANAVEALSKKLYSNYHYRLIMVKTAQKQIIGGVNFKMDVVVGMTDCRKKEISRELLDQCGLQNNERVYKKCTILVYRSISDQFKLISSACIDITTEEL